MAENRRYRMVPVVLHTAYAAAASASRPPNGVVPGLCGDDLLLEACQHQLRFGQGQTQIGDITEIIGPIDLNDVRGLPLALSASFYQPHNPGHASTPGQQTDAEIPLLVLTPPNLRQSRLLGGKAKAGL